MAARQRAPGPLRAAVVGAGRISAQHLSFLQTSPLADLVGICDSNRTLVEYMVDRYGGTAYADLTTMLNDAEVEVLHVLTPPDLHVPMATAALDLAAHVVVEKPMSLDAAGREALLCRATNVGRIVVEDQNYRFNRPMQQLLNAVSSGVLGRLTDLDVSIAMPFTGTSRHGDPHLPSPSHRLPAGFIHEYITHMAYLAVAVAPDVEVVDARWSKRVGGHASPYDELNVSVETEGLVGRLRFTSVSPRAAISVALVGTEGSAEAEMIFGSYRLDRRARPSAQLAPTANAVIGGIRSVGRGLGYMFDRFRGHDAYEGIEELLRRTYLAGLHGTAPPVTPADMRRAGDLVDRLVATMP